MPAVLPARNYIPALAQGSAKIIPEDTSWLAGDEHVLFSDFHGAPSGNLPPGFATQDTSAGGSPTLDYVDDADGGVFRLQLDTTNELEKITLYGGDSLNFPIAKVVNFKARVALTPDVTGGGGALGASDILVIGLASARNATLDSVATHCWFRMEGANNNVLVETDDGTTDDDDNDTGVDWVSGTYLELEIDCRDLTNIRVFIDRVDVTPAGGLAMAAATGNVQPFIEVSKAAAANMDHRLDIDFVLVRCER